VAAECATHTAFRSAVPAMSIMSHPRLSVMPGNDMVVRMISVKARVAHFHTSAFKEKDTGSDNTQDFTDSMDALGFRKVVSSRLRDQNQRENGANLIAGVGKLPREASAANNGRGSIEHGPTWQQPRMTVARASQPLILPTNFPDVTDASASRRTSIGVCSAQQFVQEDAEFHRFLDDAPPRRQDPLQMVLKQQMVDRIAQTGFGPDNASLQHRDSACSQRRDSACSTSVPHVTNHARAWGGGSLFGDLGSPAAVQQGMAIVPPSQQVTFSGAVQIAPVMVTRTSLLVAPPSVCAHTVQVPAAPVYEPLLRSQRARTEPVRRIRDFGAGAIGKLC